MNRNEETTGAAAGESESVLIPWILRIGVAGCFIGHGAFGVITKEAWLSYFAVAGIGAESAWKLMPLVGLMDITMGLLALLWPCRALFLWAAVWATWTALLRPLSGEPFWEFLERAGNYGVPIAILVFVGMRGAFFRRLSFERIGISERRNEWVLTALKATTITLLVGHAGLGLFVQKAGLATHHAPLGIEDPVALVPFVGMAEFFIAILAFVVPTARVFLGICIWKVSTEMLFIAAGAPFWEVIERFGSYAAPLAVGLLLWSRIENEDRAYRAVTT